MIDPAYEKAMKAARAYQFQCGATWPMCWISVSTTLKHAADRLFDLQHAAVVRQGNRMGREIEEAHRLGVTFSGELRILEGEELMDCRDTGLYSVYYMLMGYAMENVFKSILMMQHPEYFKPDGKLVDIRTHNLVSLCSRCGVTISNAESRLLEKLTEYVEWQGKYPVPLDVEKAVPRKRKDGTWDISGESFRGREVQEEIDSLYDKILDEIDRNVERGSRQRSNDVRR